MDKKVNNLKKTHIKKTRVDCFKTIIARDVWIVAFVRTFKPLKKKKNLIASVVREIWADFDEN